MEETHLKKKKQSPTSGMDAGGWIEHNSRNQKRKAAQEKQKETLEQSSHQPKDGKKSPSCPKAGEKGQMTPIFPQAGESSQEILVQVLKTLLQQAGLPQ